MESSGVPVDAGATRPVTSGQKDRSMFEHVRREREKSFASGTGPLPSRLGPEPTDYWEREKARREREETMRQSGKAPERES
jgi:hypothetical protein